MKQKLLLLFMALAALQPLRTAARDFTYTYEGQTITYTVIDEAARTCATKAGTSDVSGNSIINKLILPSTPKDGEIEYTLFSISDYAFKSCSGLTSVEIPNSVIEIGLGAFHGCSGLSSVVIGNSVTAIDGYAFSGCSDLTSVEIPNSVTFIGDNAFYGCSSLTSVKIPNSVTFIGSYVFSDCSGLISVEIPNSVRAIGSSIFSRCTGLTSIEIHNSIIGYSAFSDCTGLSSVVIGNSVTEIGDSAFSGCTGLSSVVIGNSVTEIGDSAFSGCTGLTSINIPNSVTSIGSSAFFGCYALEKVEFATIESMCNIDYQSYESNPLSYGRSLLIAGTEIKNLIIPNSVTSIGRYAFSGFEGLESVELSNSVSSIGNGAFWGCRNLASIEIPNSVTQISEYAFSNCSSLAEIKIPTSITEIEYHVFWDCTGLTSVEIPNSVTRIGEGAFRNCNSLKSVEIPNSVNEIAYSAFMDCSGLESIEIPYSVFTIGYGAFYGCSGLTSVDIPETVMQIMGYAFYGCSSLTSVEIPNFIAEIEGGTFRNCSGLTSVIIGKSVNSIGRLAFGGCANLKLIECLNTTPSKVYDTESFDASIYSTCKLRVPDESVEAYKNSYVWDKFQNINGINNTIEVTEIELNLPSAELVEGESVELTATITPADATDQSVTWTSSDESVATVDAFGNVSALKPGKATITAKTSNGLTATCVVTVVAKVIEVEGIELNLPEATIKEEETVQLIATVTPADADDQTVTWSSSNEAVATVDQDGLVTALKAGTATITARTANGLTAKCELTVETKTGIDGVEADAQVSVAGRDGVITVAAPEGAEVEVYSMTGMRVAKTREHRIEGLAGGVYIVRVAGKSFKVML